MTALPDPVLLAPRVLHNMLQLEDRARARRTDYCTNKQPALVPHMRKIVTDWMLEVCQDHKSQSQVFFLAVNYLDHFLSCVTISPSQFQLVAATCLLLASKFCCEVFPLSSDLLAVYTDDSVTAAELRLWELRVLGVLQWELSSVTAHSFLEQLSNRVVLPGGLAVTSRNLFSQADTIAALAATEYRFVLARQSVLAAAALAAAVREELGAEETVLVMKDFAAVINCSINEIFTALEQLSDSIELVLTCNTENPAAFKKNKVNTACAEHQNFIVN